MKRWFLLLVCLPASSIASDHNNLEHGRPLLVEDAYSIAFGEREFQSGFSSTFNRKNRPIYGFRSEFQYGFAKNQDFTLAFESLFPNAPTSYEASFFHNLNRELEHTPALGYRLGIEQEGGRTHGQLTLAATKALRQYDKVHANVLLDTEAGPTFLLGYSSPVGYPKVFDTTMLAELGVRSGTALFGLGMRKQISAQAVVDLGIQRQGSMTRLIAGYSIGF